MRAGSGAVRRIIRLAFAQSVRGALKTQLGCHMRRIDASPEFFRALGHRVLAWAGLKIGSPRKVPGLRGKWHCTEPVCDDRTIAMLHGRVRDSNMKRAKLVRV